MKRKTLRDFLAEAKDDAPNPEDIPMGLALFGKHSIDESADDVIPSGQVGIRPDQEAQDADGTDERQGEDGDDIVGADKVIPSQPTALGTPGDTIVINPTLDPNKAR